MSEAKQLAIQSHLDNGVFATFVQNKFGGILEVPENVFLKQDSRQYLYEIDDDTLNIYVHGIKNKTFKLPRYCIRPFIMMDMICSMANMGISPLLLKVFNDEKKEIPCGDDALTTKRAVNLLGGPQSKRQQILEVDMFRALDNFVINSSVDLVTEDILEGFEIISKNYLDRVGEL